jgi:hypothetical protein
MGLIVDSMGTPSPLVDADDGLVGLPKVVLGAKFTDGLEQIGETDRKLKAAACSIRPSPKFDNSFSSYVHPTNV